jgi:hypothetical protein
MLLSLYHDDEKMQIRYGREVVVIHESETQKPENDVWTHDWDLSLPSKNTTNRSFAVTSYLLVMALAWFPADHLG